MLVRIFADSYWRAAHSCIRGCAFIRARSGIAKRQYEADVLKPRGRLGVGGYRGWAEVSL